MKCPYCLENFHVSWYQQPGSLVENNITQYAIRHTVCPSCEKIIIQLGSLTVGEANFWEYQLIKPRSISRTPLPASIPEVFTSDYKEACLVLSDSPKASAALSRRCLQNILREKASVKKSDLSNEIQQILDSKTLPPYITNDLDAIRNIGNFAAHPIKDTNTGEIVNVEPGEAEWNLDVLESLFDYYFIQPEIASKKRTALNDKLKAAGKPLMKESSS